MTDAQNPKAQRANPPVPEPAPGVPRFDSCLIDENASIVEVTIGNDKFRMRSITAGEASIIWQRSRLKDAPETAPSASETQKFLSMVDFGAYSSLTVCAALGGLRDKPLGNEGWTLVQADGSPLPVNEYNVGRLIEAAILVLYKEHQGFFRPERFGIAKSGADSGMESGPEDG